MNSGFAEGFAVGQGNNNGFGNGSEVLWIILLFALLGGGFGGGWNNGGSQMGYDLGKVATTNDVASGFTNSAIMGNQRELALTLSNMQNYINQGFSGLNVQILTGVNDISRQISDCCCTTQRAIDNVNFNMERNTSAINNTIHEEFCGLYKYLDTKEIENLKLANAELKSELRAANEREARNAQTGYIINAVTKNCWCNDGCGCF